MGDYMSDKQEALLKLAELFKNLGEIRHALK